MSVNTHTFFSFPVFHQKFHSFDHITFIVPTLLPPCFPRKHAQYKVQRNTPYSFRKPEALVNSFPNSASCNSTITVQLFQLVSELETQWGYKCLTSQGILKPIN